MNIDSNFLFYTLAIGTLSGLNTYGFTMIKSNPIVFLFWEFLLICIIQGVWVYSSKEPIISESMTKDVFWVFLMAITATTASYLMARAFQNYHFNPAIFTLANTTISSIVLIGIGYFFLHSELNPYNILGLALGVTSIYLLNIK